MIFHWAGVLAIDTGIALVFLSLVSLLRLSLRAVRPSPRPPRLLFPRTGKGAAAAALSGILLAVAGMTLPSGPIRLAGPPMRIDAILPSYQFAESHQTVVKAPLPRVYEAVRSVSAAEIRLFQALTWIRSPRLPGRGKESILNPSATRPILDVALGSGFLLLHEEPGREIVIGALVCCGRRVPPATPAAFLALAGEPGVALAVMSFHLEESFSPPQTLVRTQTRVLATDDDARRRFAAYWRTIYPGSAFIRRMWLSAIRRRAEAAR